MPESNCESDGLDRGEAVLRWAVETFGEAALDPVERALRFLEEAMELAQAAGVTAHQSSALALRTWGRECGRVPQEAAQAQLTLEMLAEVLRVGLDDVAEREFARITKLPAAHHRRRQAAKVKGGIAT